MGFKEGTTTGHHPLDEVHLPRSSMGRTDQETSSPRILPSSIEFTGPQVISEQRFCYIYQLLLLHIWALETRGVGLYYNNNSGGTNSSGSKQHLMLIVFDVVVAVAAALRTYYLPNGEQHERMGRATQQQAKIGRSRNSRER